MNSVNTAFIKLTLFFVAGILAGFFISIDLILLIFLFAGIFALFLLSYFRAKKLFFQDIYFGIATFLMLFFAGIITTQLHLPENQPQHYSNNLPSETDFEATPVLVTSVTEELKPDIYNRKFIAEVEQINRKSVHGKLLLLIQKDSTNPEIDTDDRIILSSKLQKIPAPLNPHQFNYRRFMENRGILQQVHLKQGNYQVISTPKTSLKGWAANRRKEIVEDLRNHHFKQEELGIIQALLLGQRQDISEEIYNNYAAAGVIHILAVSGLHVGIILYLLHRLFSPLERFKHGRFIKTFLLIILLWLFAIIAGLSPSVVRAVTMFSFVAIGLQIKRRTSVLNTLFMSMMILLLVRPQFLFEVGFQLSYLAVFSIVLLQPPLYNLLNPGNVATKYLWGLLTVTIAAQAGVLPLSLFYFHQFPGLFFVSNLVILPFMGIILGFGIIVMFLALVDLLPEFLTETYSFLISSLNDFVGFVAKQESFLFRDIPFSGYQALVFYVLVATLFLLLKKINYRRIVLVLTAVLILQIVYYTENFRSIPEEFVIFHKSRNTLIGEKSGKNLTLHHNLSETPEEQNIIRNYLVGEKIETVKPEQLKNVYGIGEEILIVIDSSAVYPEQKTDYVLLTNSPKLNLERLLVQLQPKIIVADGSNYKSYVERWEETCKQKDIPFHSTGTNGAFILQK